MATTGSKLTTKGLPVVTQDTFDALWETHTTGGERWGKRLTEVQRRLVEEQPVLVKFIESQISKYSQGTHEAIIDVVVATLAVLEDSAEANQLSSKYKTS